MKLNELRDVCGEITKSKGFDCTQHLKQLLLIADEVNEAIEHIGVDGDTHNILRDFHINFDAMFKVFKSYRKNSTLDEITRITDHEKLSEELADIIIRVLSYSAVNKIDIEKHVLLKIEKNKERPVLHGQKF